MKKQTGFHLAITIPTGPSICANRKRGSESERERERERERESPFIEANAFDIRNDCSRGLATSIRSIQDDPYTSLFAPPKRRCQFIMAI